jgi:signal transduction histidine kinase
MYEARHRKQILLFLIAVILPSAVLVFFTSRMIHQERELAEKRERDQRLLLAREFGESLLSRLERIKQEELEAYRDSPVSESTPGYTHSEVELIGLVESGDLKLPWELELSATRSLALAANSSFSQQIQEGERAEFGQKNPQQAAAHYRGALNSAGVPVQRGYARLLLARVLKKMGQKGESRANYQEVLQLPFELVDEAGIPLALYAADSLIPEKIEGPAVVKRIQVWLSSSDWVSPPAAYFTAELLEAIATSQVGQAARQITENCRRLAGMHIEIIEQALALKRELPKLGLVPERDEPGRESPLWVPFGQMRWLVSLVDFGAESRSLLLAVGAEDALDSVVSGPTLTAIPSVGFSLVSATSTEGEALGRSFPGLNLAITDGPEGRLSEPSSLRFFYLFAVILVLSVTFFGAYLLWRDVRREVKAAELRSQFVSSVSHELKTPLTAIQMFAETLRLGRTRNPKSRQEYLETIVNESQRLTRLLNNVLDFSRIESGKRVYHPQPTDLKEVIQDAVKAMEYPLRQRGIELAVETEDNFPRVSVDRDGLEQAILNLLDNAMKYSGDSRRIHLKLGAEDTNAVIRVADRGLGIDPRDQQRIFEKFHRVSSPESGPIPGTGLGLSLVSHLVRAHGGRVEVRSKLGEGSTFSIYLPAEERR